jgi:hypothetical protein
MVAGTLHVNVWPRQLSWRYRSVSSFKRYCQFVLCGQTGYHFFSPSNSYHGVGGKDCKSMDFVTGSLTIVGCSSLSWSVNHYDVHKTWTSVHQIQVKFTEWFVWQIPVRCIQISVSPNFHSHSIKLLSILSLILYSSTQFSLQFHVVLRSSSTLSSKSSN